jgi:hypothetical protein
MSGDLEWILFEFASDEALRDRSRFVKLMSEIVKQSDFRFRPSLTHTYPPTIIEEDSIDALTTAWDTAHQRGQHGALINCVRPNGFSVGFGVDFGNYGRLHVTTNNGYISSLEPVHYENVESLAWICETAYVAMHPEYGYGMVSPATHPFAVSAPWQSGDQVWAVFDFNFYGPKLAAALGRDRLKSAPTWKTREFDDGGTFLQMSPSPIADWKPYRQNYEGTAEILGVERIYQGG